MHEEGVYRPLAAAARGALKRGFQGWEAYRIPWDTTVGRGIGEDLLLYVSQTQQLWTAGAAQWPGHCQLRRIFAVIAWYA